MTSVRNYNREFDYQLTHYVDREELEPFVQQLNKYDCREKLYYVIKKNGRQEKYAIFTKGESINDTPKDICRREMREGNI